MQCSELQKQPLFVDRAAACAHNQRRPLGLRPRGRGTRNGEKRLWMRCRAAGTTRRAMFYGGDLGPPGKMPDGRCCGIGAYRISLWNMVPWCRVGADLLRAGPELLGAVRVAALACERQRAAGERRRGGRAQRRAARPGRRETARNGEKRTVGLVVHTEGLDLEPSRRRDCLI